MNKIIEHAIELAETYPPCKGQLRRTNSCGSSMCIMGLIAESFHELTGRGEWIREVTEPFEDEWFFKFGDYSATASLSIALLEELGLTSLNQSELWYQNDHYTRHAAILYLQEADNAHQTQG